MYALKESTKKLVEKLFEKLPSDKLSMGAIYFDNGFDSKVAMTNNKEYITRFIEEKGRADGPATRPATSITEACSMLNLGRASEKESVKFIILVTDGKLQDEEDSISIFQDLNNLHGVNTRTIFVDIEATTAFENLAIDTPHKNYQTTSVNLEETIADEIYSDIYMQVIQMMPPETTYKVNNAGMIAGDDKIIIQADEEIMHGSTLEIEYIINFTSKFDINNILIKDLYSKPLKFYENQKMLTENKKNSDYNWQMDGNNLVYRGTNIKAGEPHEIKLVLTAVLTPTVLRNLDKIGNSVEVEFEYTAEDGTKKIGGNKITETPGNKITDAEGNVSEINTDIKASDILIIPPTGTEPFYKRVEWTLNMTVGITSILLIIVCIIDYAKEKRKK